MKRGLWLTLACLVFAPAALAQDCPAQSQQALDLTQELCSEIEANRICYGQRTATALFRDGFEDTVFSAPGDVIPTDTATFVSVSTEDATWGAARLVTQAYTGADWQPQDVTMILFGNVQLQNEGEEGADQPTLDLTVTTTEGANIRSQPSTDYRVLARAALNDTLKVTGRLADDSWLRVILPDGRSGWVSSAVVDADFSAAPVVEAGDTLSGGLYKPFADFYLQTGSEDAPCPGAPESGLLVQTPAQSDPASLRVNGVDLMLAGTAFLQAQASGELVINVLTGSATATTLDQSQYAMQGYRLRVPMDDALDGTPDPLGPPETAEPYDYDRMAGLPLNLLPEVAFVGVSLERIVRPAPADGSEPLSHVLPGDPCTIAATSNVNLRSGPGTAYPIIGEMTARQSARPDGYWFLAGGAPWWRLAPGVWVSWQAVFYEGACNAVPHVGPPD